MVGQTSATGTNGICVKYGGATLMADSATVNRQTGEVVADGHVRIEQGDQIWVGEHIRYNFKTHQMQSEEFRTGKPPVFAAGRELQGDISNKTYNARHVFVTTDDVSDPAIRVRASRIKIVPGKYVEMWNAVLYHGRRADVLFSVLPAQPGPAREQFQFHPRLPQRLRAVFAEHLHLVSRRCGGRKVSSGLPREAGRGRGAGPEPAPGPLGEAAFKYYYLHDQNSNARARTARRWTGIPKNRQRFYLGYQATPFTNLNVKALVNYQSDPLVLHDFFEGAYRNNPQPKSFTEVNRYWNNWN